MKQELQMRLAIAGFMQDALQSMASKNKKFEDDDAAASAAEVCRCMGNLVLHPLADCFCSLSPGCGVHGPSA